MIEMSHISTLKTIINSHMSTEHLKCGVIEELNFKFHLRNLILVEQYLENGHGGRAQWIILVGIVARSSI